MLEKKNKYLYTYQKIKLTEFINLRILRKIITGATIVLCMQVFAQKAPIYFDNNLTKLYTKENPTKDNLPVQNEINPLDVVKKIGDKLIRETPFKYSLSVAQINPIFNGVQFVDFGRTFLLGKPAVAYAFTSFNAPKDMEMAMQIEHNDGCKIWLDGHLVYEKKGDRRINLIYDERSIEMSNQCKLKLHKGKNDILIKSETKGDEWRVYIQPPSTKGAILSEDFLYPQIGLSEIANIDSSIAKLTNWLVIGPFKNPISGNKRIGIDIEYAPEKEFRFGYMYLGLNGQVTWTIPKIEVLGTMINPKEWGTNYNWNYHNGGVAWAMEQLAELSGEKKYDDYATNFCNFHIEGIPYVKYQVQELNAYSSANNQIINTPLLDFTLAPSLPIIYKLRKYSSFPNRDKYVSFINGMIKYAQHDQLRLPGFNIFTRTSPEKYTTWTDDMFMGIPFLVQASKYENDPEIKKTLMNDAACQLIAFNSQVWDSNTNLYMHAGFSGRKVQLPHWSRANGWAIWAMSEVLMGMSSSDPKYNVIMEQYRRFVCSLVNFQNKNGFWFNVLDRPDSREEVSGTAIFTMAIARGVIHGWLDAKTYTPIVIKGWDALKTQIEPDGTVHNICMGTMCSEDINYYLNRPFYDNDTHGVLGVLFAGMEVFKMISTENHQAFQ